MIHACLNFCMIGHGQGNISGKSQGILISCVSGNPAITDHHLF